MTHKKSYPLKAMQDDPWIKSAKQYEVGQVIAGTVTKVTPFGAFVQLDKDIHGLAHVSELAATGQTPGDILSVGEKHNFKILSIEPTEHRLGLSLEDSQTSVVKKTVAKKLEEKTATKKAAPVPSAKAKKTGSKTKSKEADKAEAKKTEKKKTTKPKKAKK